MIVVEDLVKTYPGTRKTPPVEAVRGIGFAVGRGEVFGLLGPNGAGKSTTLGCMTTLVRPSAGRISIDGLDLATQPFEVRERLGVVPQTRNLDRDLTLREMLLFHGAYFGMPKADRAARATLLLRLLQLEEKAKVKPATLSGGLQQRAMIARALMHRPRVLLLDEPTVGLDPQTRRLLWDLLAKLRADGLTMILTTHYMEEADALCDRVAIIDHGKILALDTAKNLKDGLPGAHVIDLAVRWRGAMADAALAGDLEGVQRVVKVETVETADQDALHLRLFVEPGEGVLDRVLSRVRESNGELDHVSLSPPSLEDVYIHLTGKDRMA
jgi:ABC-2 type transport system ATP-binding protein